MLELRDALLDAAGSSSDASKHLRVARACVPLREWVQCLAAVKAGQSSTSVATAGSEQREELAKYRNLAEAELAGRSEERLLSEIRASIFDKDNSVDSSFVPHGVYNDMRALHFAVASGDVRLLEGLVSLGAALDLPPIEHSSASTGTGFFGQTTLPLPPGCTALVFGCMTLALNFAMQGLNSPQDVVNASLSAAAVWCFSAQTAPPASLSPRRAAPTATRHLRTSRA